MKTMPNREYEPFQPTPYNPSAPASFTPTPGNFKPLQPFRYWCQKVLPLVYDDSLSYYELLCKVVEYLNQTMEDVETLHSDTDNLRTAYSELQADYNEKYGNMSEWINESYQELVTFVNTYFDNLDVQEYINNKLDAMVLSGEMTALISPLVPDIVTTWLNENVDPVGSAVVVDSSLSITGAAADAKVTGDKINNLTTDLTSLIALEELENKEEYTEIETFDFITYASTTSFPYGMRNGQFGLRDGHSYSSVDWTKCAKALEDDAIAGFDGFKITPPTGYWVSVVAFNKDASIIYQGGGDNSAIYEYGIIGRVDESLYIPIDHNLRYVFSTDVDWDDLATETVPVIKLLKRKEKINETDISDLQKKALTLDLFNNTDYIKAGYLNATGNIKANNAWRTLFKYPVYGSNKIYLKGKYYKSTGGGLSNVWCYDANGNSLGSAYLSPDSNTPIDTFVDLLPNTHYVSVSNTLTLINEGSFASLWTIQQGITTVPANLQGVTMIPIFGQSLSVGVDALPVISTSAKYKAEIMFNGGVLAENKAVNFFTSFQSLHESNVETPASGIADKIIEQIQKDEGISVNSDYWNTHQILFVSCGKGAQNISELMSGYYTGLQNAIQGAKNICDNLGLTLNVPCWVFIQGETDQVDDTSYSDYKTALITLQTNFNTYVKSVTGQENNIKCVLYQVGGQNIAGDIKYPTYTNTDIMNVPLAHMHLVRDNDNFVASTPVYVCTHNNRSYHLTGEGSKMLGEYCGIACKSIMFGEKSPTGLVPLSYTISDNTLSIVYDVPVPPIRIDTEWVNEVAHYGYVLLNSNDEDIISSVSVFNDTVTIECTESPINAMLFYGFNGTQRYDGRIAGSRGNICDSAKFTESGEIGGKIFTLGNYAYDFVKLLNDTSGTI